MNIRTLIWSMAAGFLLSTCKSKDAPTSTIVWTGTGAPPTAFSSPQFATTERTLLVQGELIRFSKQRWGNATVEGGVLQTIESSSGKLQYGKAKFEIPPEIPPTLSVVDLDLLHHNRFQFLEKLKEKKVLPSNSKILSEPEVIVHRRSATPVASYAIDLLNRKTQSVERYLISPKFAVLSSEKISSDFDLAAWLFTPENSNQLQEVILKSLVDGPAIQSFNLQVQSQAPGSASTKDAPWKFAPEDPRFDQVQAFYFTSLGIDFFSHQLEFTIPTSIQIETYQSYPEKVNAAFTYTNQIRIGYGDGVTYKGLARDPSVVIHELGHVVTWLIAHLPTQKEGGSINEGLVDFFAGSYLNDPKMGHLSYVPGPYRRNLEDFIPFKEKNGGLYHDSQIVSGTLWQIRTALGAPLAQKLAMRTLARLGPATKLTEFSDALRLAAADMKAEEIAIINGILEKFSWPPYSVKGEPL